MYCVLNIYDVSRLLSEQFSFVLCVSFIVIRRYCFVYFYSYLGRNTLNSLVVRCYVRLFVRLYCLLYYAQNFYWLEAFFPFIQFITKIMNLYHVKGVEE